MTGRNSEGRTVAEDEVAVAKAESAKRHAVSLGQGSHFQVGLQSA